MSLEVTIYSPKICIHVTIYCGNIDPLTLVSGSIIDNTYIHTETHNLWANETDQIFFTTETITGFSAVVMCRCVKRQHTVHKSGLIFAASHTHVVTETTCLAIHFLSVISNERWQTDSEATKGLLECSSWPSVSSFRKCCFDETLKNKASMLRSTHSRGHFNKSQFMRWQMLFFFFESPTEDKTEKDT